MRTLCSWGSGIFPWIYEPTAISPHPTGFWHTVRWRGAPSVESTRSVHDVLPPSSVTPKPYHFQPPIINVYL